MSEHTASPTADVKETPAPTQAPPPPAPMFPVPRSWKVAFVVAVVMVVLAMIGVSLSTADSAAAPVYWIALVPVFAVLCVATAWTHDHRETRRLLVTRQAFHWLGVAAALGMDFLIRRAGQESGTASGLTALLLLALGCYLAGIHLEWMFVLVGLFLTLALFIVTYARDYLWLFVIVGTLAILGLFFVAQLLGVKGRG
jgi:hypothetical protein